MKIPQISALDFPAMKPILAALGAALLGIVQGHSTLIVDLPGSNYTPVSNGQQGGMWTDSSSSGNNATPTTATLNAGKTASATPSGQAAVNFNYRVFTSSNTTDSKPFKLATPLTSANFTTAPDFSLFAVVNLQTLTTNPIFLMDGAEAGDLTWRLNVNGTQTLTSVTVGDVGTSTGTAFTTGTWSILTVTYGSGTYAFYLNGAQVGTGSSARTFTTPTFSEIGGGLGVQTAFLGLVADFQIYDSAMNSSQVTAQYNTLYNSYISPEPSTWALLAVGLAVVVTFRRRPPQF